MAFKFNPFTGNLDLVEVGAGGGAATPGGADTQVQFNDGGSFAGDSGLAYNDTAGALTVGGKTVTTDAPIINLSQTWNNAATTFTGLKLNVTDTASAADSNLLDLQVGGTSKFKFISSNNEIALPTAAASSISFRSFSLVATLYNRTVLSCNENGELSWPQGVGVLGSCILDGGKAIEYTTNKITFQSVGFAADVQLKAIDAGTLQLDDRAGGPGKFYVVNTYTDASNYERGFLKWDTNVFKIGTENDGTGTARGLTIQTGGTDRVTLGGTNGLTIDGSVSQIFADCTTYFASTTAAGSRALAGDGFAVGSAYAYSFSSTTGANGTPDTGLARDSAGVVKVTDGSAGTGYLKLIPTTVGALTAAATVGAGTKAFVTDATNTLASHHGDVVAGGGSNFTPVYSDGIDWRIG